MTWLLLRGLSREARHWALQLQDTLTTCGAPPPQIIALDLPGTGQSRHLLAPAEVGLTVELLREQLAVLCLQSLSIFKCPTADFNGTWR